MSVFFTSPFPMVTLDMMIAIAQRGADKNTVFVHSICSRVSMRLEAPNPEESAKIGKLVLCDI